MSATNLHSATPVRNRQLMPRLWALNAMPMDLMPELVPGPVANVDLKELGDFITAMARAGEPLFPDRNLEEHVRAAAGLPEPAVDPDMMGALDGE